MARFSDPIRKTFSVPSVRFVFFELVSRTLLLQLGVPKSRRLGVSKPGFREECFIASFVFIGIIVMDFGVGVCRFSEALGAVFLTFVVLETSFKNDGFLDS